MSNKLNILFTATFSTPFIREDIKILKSHYNLIEIISSGPNTILKFLSVIKEIDITYSWFASIYSSIVVFLGRMLKKKSIIIIGGVDVAKEKEYDYGIWNSWWKSIIVRYGIINADSVLAVDESLKSEAIRLAKYNGNNIVVVPTGYDSQRWKPDGEKKSIVLSIGMAHDMSRFKKKGFDILFSVAERMKGVKFVVIGILDGLRNQIQIPGNVQCFSFLAQDDLLRYFQNAKVFCQLSRHEGLPNTLCEAMLCECIPVGSNKFGIPNGIGDAGYVVDLKDENEIIRVIHSALIAPPELGKKARERIIENFSLERRNQKLKEIIESLR